MDIKITIYYKIEKGLLMLHFVHCEIVPKNYLTSGTEGGVFFLFFV
jgi:hypothetical protein